MHVRGGVDALELPQRALGEDLLLEHLCDLFEEAKSACQRERELAGKEAPADQEDARGASEERERDAPS